MSINISSRHSHLNFGYHFVIYCLLQNGGNKHQHQESHQGGSYMIISIFFAKLGRQKRSLGWAKYVYVYVSMICADGIFVSFPCWLKIVKSRPKVAFFLNERHFEIWFRKKETKHFSEENYLNYTKKTIFCMWQWHFPLNNGKQGQVVDPFVTPWVKTFKMQMFRSAKTP